MRRLTGQNPLHPASDAAWLPLSFPEGRHLGRRNQHLSRAFNDAIARINPDLGADDITSLLTDVKLLLVNEDLGKAFYDRFFAAQPQVHAVFCPGVAG